MGSNYNPRAKKIVARLKDRGINIRLAVAGKPFFSSLYCDCTHLNIFLQGFQGIGKSSLIAMCMRAFYLDDNDIENTPPGYGLYNLLYLLS